MITIYKGDRTARVPSGSFKSHFQPYGWRKTPSSPVEAPTEPPKPSVDNNPGEHTPPQEQPSTAPESGSTDTEESIAKMNDQELKQYAALLGIKTKDLNSREEVLEAIKAAQK